jgi:hypothetical protein
MAPSAWWIFVELGCRFIAEADTTAGILGALSQIYAWESSHEEGSSH